jgi:hypothetical protein
MNGQDAYDRFAKQYPHPRGPFFERPHWTRRRFFGLAGGVTGAYLASRSLVAADGRSSGATPKNTARNVVFILANGGISQTDTFDFRMIDGTTPKSFAPETVNGVLWPMGLLPKLGQHLSEFAIVRSLRAHALEHNLARTWTQIGRNPTTGPNAMAPHIGSVVAIEKDQERLPGQKFPTFVALNSEGVISGPGYFPANQGPFKIVPVASGLNSADSPAGPERFARRWQALRALDGGLRVSSPAGKPVDDYDEFYREAQGLAFNPAVQSAFGFSASDSARYGSSSTGNACLIAYQVIKAQQGTRFIQVTSNDAWDMHGDIYLPTSGISLGVRAPILDNAVSSLLADLKSSGLLASTLVVMLSEFGRTVGKTTIQGGRDHYLQHFAMLAGGGIKGGTIIGQTNADGGDVAEYGWSRQRYVWIEDIEATIYSAMGIDWTYIRRDDPLHRGFQYVPFSEQDLYGPVHELWG